MSNGSYEVKAVVGSGSVQKLICEIIHLPTQAEEIKNILKTVIIDNCKVVYDKVIIDGRLRKDIQYKEACKGFPPPGEVKACEGVTAAVFGPMQDLDLEISFNLFIDVPGAQPGDECVVLQAFVEGEKEEATEFTHEGAFEGLIDKSLVFICVKVVREMITTSLAGGGTATSTGQATNGTTQICPPHKSTGVFIGGHGTIPAPVPGPVAGTWVGPTLIFAGFINLGRVSHRHHW